jgi:transaldolase
MPYLFMNLPNSPNPAGAASALTSPNALSALKRFTTVVADTGSFDSMRAYQPQDATTNPTLIIKALDQPRYASILAQIKAATQGAPLADRTRQVLVAFGQEILKIVPGRVST